MRACRRCGQVQGAIPHQKYCGDGNDKDFSHDYIEMPEVMANVDFCPSGLPCRHSFRGPLRDSSHCYECGVETKRAFAALGEAFASLEVPLAMQAKIEALEDEIHRMRPDVAYLLSQSPRRKQYRGVR